MREPLLATKLLAPQPRAALVARPRLVARIDDGVRRRLTLVCAPAGFGKTTLVTAWRSAAGQALPVAWLSLDEADNDPARFLDYAIAALGTVLPGLGVNARAMLGESPSPSTEAVVTVLVNELADLDRDVVLVLDDYQLIHQEAVHHGVGFFLDHAPPQAHLIIATRVEPPLPLARLRARDQVVEIRVEDLRFTPEEAAAFMDRSMGVAVTPDQAAAIEARTEGWVAGLQLAGLALRQRAGANPDAVLASFGGGHRYVLDYLADEVLAGQDAAMRDFLLRSSVLVHLAGPLCDAVLGRSDSQALLEQLCAANLFIVALDDEARWYRYHRLFRDFLTTRLAESFTPEAIAALHRRAGDWHLANGFSRRAVADYLAAGDDAAAADVIEQIADEMWTGGRVTALNDWLAELPEATFFARPRLALLRAWVTVLLGQSFDRVEPDLARVEAARTEVARIDAAHAETGDSALADATVLGAKIDTVRAAVASLRGDAVEAIALSERALAVLPGDDAAWRGANFLNLGLARANRGAYSAAAEAFAGARAIGVAAGDDYTIVMATVNLARALGAGGRLHEAERMYRRALDQAAERGLKRMPLAGLAWIGLGELAHEWNDMAEAEDLLRRGLATGEGLPIHLRVGAAGLLALARVQWDRGDFEAATASIGTAADLVRRHHRPEYLTAITTYRARLALAASDWVWLERWGRTRLPAASSKSPAAAPAGSPPEADHAPEPSPVRWDETLTLGHWLARRSGALFSIDGLTADTGTALQILHDLLAEVEAVGEPRYIIEVLAALATAHACAGQDPAARIVLRRALAMAEPEGYVRTFLEAGEPVRDLIRALHTARTTARRHPARDGRAIRPPVGIGGSGPPEASIGYLARLLEAADGPAATKVPTEVGTAAPAAGMFKVPVVAAAGMPPVPSADAADRRIGEGVGDNLVEPLTEREIEVLGYIADGLSNREIAERMVVAVSTVKTHINHLYGKLGVDSRTRALAEARRRGLIV
jgi:LuxR family maltose regulon positive regulatory protein